MYGSQATDLSQFVLWYRILGIDIGQSDKGNAFKANQSDNFDDKISFVVLESTPKNNLKTVKKILAPKRVLTNIRI